MACLIDELLCRVEQTLADGDAALALTTQLSRSCHHVFRLFEALCALVHCHAVP
jgi:hypothetical protein